MLHTPLGCCTLGTADKVTLDKHARCCMPGAVLTRHVHCAQIKAEEIDILLKGAGALDISSVRKKPKVLTPGAVPQSPMAYACCLLQCLSPRGCHA